MLMAILAIILTLIFVVGIHEAGHAVAAFFTGVKIKRISIGFGKPLLQWQNKNGCEWVWAMWPLGGYVQLLNSRIAPVSSKEYSFCFDKKPVWVRLFILISGILANILTAWLAFVLVFYVGIDFKVPQIGAIQADSVAAQSGLHIYDQIIAIEGYPTSSWNEVGMQLLIHWGSKNLNVTIKQQGADQLKNTSLDLSHVQFIARKGTSLLSSIGISPNQAAPKELIQASSLIDAFSRANQTMIHWFYYFIMVIKQMVTGLIPFSVLLGPVGLFALSINTLAQGVLVFLFFLAALSVAVALVNIVPFPGLDGGALLYLLVEKIRGKPISVAMEVLLHRLMLIIFTVLLIQLLLNDFLRFIH